MNIEPNDETALNEKYKYVAKLPRRVIPCPADYAAAADFYVGVAGARVLDSEKLVGAVTKMGNQYLNVLLSLFTTTNKTAVDVATKLDAKKEVVTAMSSNDK